MDSKDDAPALSVEQAYEACYRFVWQYATREPDSVSLQLMLVAMQPVADHAKTNDPASWPDWLESVGATIRGDALPAFPEA